MKPDISKGLQKRKKQILEDWMTQQLSSAGFREDLTSNEELREQSNELLDTLVKSINDRNISDPESSDFEPVYEILSGISISRARQGLWSEICDQLEFVCQRRNFLKCLPDYFK